MTSRIETAVPLIDGQDDGPGSGELCVLRQPNLAATRFGEKAAGLSDAIQLGAKVPFGFALSRVLTAQICSGRVGKSVSQDLRRAFESAILQSNVGRVIVRSSHYEEAGTDLSVSGRFVSVPNISEFWALEAAIRRCAQSFDSAESTDGQPIPVIVQSQQRCEFSGILLVDPARFHLEIYRGDLGLPISGIGMPSVIVGHCGSSGDPVASLEVDVQRIGSARAFEHARNALAAVPRSSGSFLFELGLVDGCWSIFQMQPFAGRWPSREVGIAIGSTPPTVLQSRAMLGAKAAAMLYFKERGLFPSPLVVVPAGEAPPSARSFEWKGLSTVRFSSGDKLGLPRHFVSDRTDLDRLLVERDSSWTAIVHPFLAVVRSFEMLLESDRILVEHVPGMWESENRAPPDAIVLNQDECVGFRWTEPRVVRAGTSLDGTTQKAAPIAVATMERWVARASEVAQALRRDFANDLPLNFHFVEDTSGEWHFLNVRAGHSLAKVATLDKLRGHIVRTMEDFESWDGRVPILLQVTSARGSESQLVPLAEVLKGVKVPIYPIFGMLSHPAMVLQAFGVVLTPAYVDDGFSEFGSYEQVAVKIDRGKDPLARIAAEPSLYEDDFLKVVRDREPIVRNHLLIMAQESVPSFADSPRSAAALSDLAHSTEVKHGFGSICWLFYERGRAQFCTSGFTSAHAHCHLLPRHSFNRDAVGDLAELTKAKRFDEIETALIAARAFEGEYLVFGSDDDGIFLARLAKGVAFPKRFVRNFLRERRS